MNVQTVYRVETKTGTGPYITSIPGARASIDFDDNRQPGPNEDGLSGFDRGYHFGFASIEQLKAWFREEERERLSQLGFVVHAYNATEFKLGGKQVVFKLNKRRRKRDPLHLLAL